MKQSDKLFSGIPGEQYNIKKSIWKENVRYDFYFDGRESIIIAPEKPASGNPWIWRAEFFDAFSFADMALLKLGWHIVYYKVSNMYGCPQAVELMHQFNKYVVEEWKLHPHTVLFGFSRGGLYAFNYAAAYPGKVALLYLDAPVLDIKSWPGGKGTGIGARHEWEECLQIYGLNEETAIQFKENPLDKINVVANAGITIIVVAGDADDVVPYAENAKILEKEYLELGGNIKVVIKEGIGHHPHSLENPQLIIDFILGNVKN